MRAIIHERYADPSRLRAGAIDRPSVAASEVLVRVRAASVNPADWHYTTGGPHLVRLETGLTRPKRGVLGLDAAGVVEEVGEARRVQREGHVRSEAVVAMGGGEAPVSFAATAPEESEPSHGRL